MLGIAAAFLLVSVIVGHLAYISGVERERGHQSPAAYAAAAKKDAERSCIGTEASAVFECVYERTQTAADQANAEQDLQAQQGMKFWAAVMAFVALGTLVLTGIALWYVKGTLDATRKMASDTRDMVEETGEATGAMIEANKIAREQYFASFKPWLIPSIEGPYASNYPDGNDLGDGRKAYQIDANLRVTNRTDMPAIILDCDWEIIGGDTRALSRHEADTVLGKGDAFLFPSLGRTAAEDDEWKAVTGESFHIANLGMLLLTEDELASVRFNPPPIFARVLYADPLGNRRMLGFAYRTQTIWTDQFRRWGGESYNFDRPTELERLRPFIG